MSNWGYNTLLTIEVKTPFVTGDCGQLVVVANPNPQTKITEKKTPKQKS